MKIVPQLVLIQEKETFSQCLAKDAVTLAMLSLCVWISGDELIWQVVSFTLFMLMLLARLAKSLITDRLVFSSFADLSKWVEDVRDDK